MTGRGAIWIAISLFVALMALALPAAAPAEHAKLELITTGTGPEGNGTGRDPVQVSQDGRRVLFQAWDALVPEDTDDCTDPEYPDDVLGCPDMYERSNGVTSLVTTGPNDPHGQFPHHFLGASPTLDRVLFLSSASLVGEDTDSASDLYGRINGTTTLLSPSAQGAPGNGVINVSRDGGRVFFASPDRLVPEDTDDCIDFYELSSDTNKLMTPNVGRSDPFTCANVIRFLTSADGSHFFWMTGAKVTAEDLDVTSDIYETFNGQVRLVSTGPADTAEGGSLSAGAAVSADGTTVVFSTTEKLVAEDTDVESDLYERSDGDTRLVAPPADGDTSPSFGFRGMSADGNRVIGLTDAHLAPGDTDSQTDLYAIVDRTPELLSNGSSGGNGAHTVMWLGTFPIGPGSLDPIWVNNLPAEMSGDGRVVTFSTTEQLVPEDTDELIDLYANVDGMVRLISTGTNDVDQSFGWDSWRGGSFVSPDGSRIFFLDDAPFAVEDDDAVVDVYEWHAGSTSVVPHGVPTPDPVYFASHEYAALVPDGSRVFIGTETPLTPDDTGDAADLYDIYGVALNGSPDCNGVTAKPRRLWPPNHRFRPVAIAGATDPDGDDVTLEITGVTQDERTGRLPDAKLKPGRNWVGLRAERQNRDGRVYRVAFEASDGNGGTCDGTVSVSVPRHKHRPARDSAPPGYNSLG